MKAVILAGGLGTRLSEETSVRPKPMVEIGEQPLLWHILKMYSHYGINEFIIAHEFWLKLVGGTALIWVGITIYLGQVW